MPDEIDVKLNGKQFGIGAVSQGLVILLVGALLIWVARVGMDMRDFMAAGDRCTSGECGSMERAIEMHTANDKQYRRYHEDRSRSILLEQQRLQRQIDRLESVVFNGKQKPDLRPYGND